MLINADFSRRAIVLPHQQRWQASPQTGVLRAMLDRVGAEQARATSLVRYAPGSRFPRHGHPGGEEILVLSGLFSEQGQDHGPGSYLRNPPGSAHSPHSAPGALIFVKLRQMPEQSRRAVYVDSCAPSAWHALGDGAVCPLYADAREQVALHRLPPGQPLPYGPNDHGLAELLVLEGALQLEGRDCPRGSWMRLPTGDRPLLAAGEQGATLYLKTGTPAGLDRQD
jgi:anti-sigma factor ChrR (cupin superfamily)